jgi:hypothetical protein
MNDNDISSEEKQFHYQYEFFSRHFEDETCSPQDIVCCNECEYIRGGWSVMPECGIDTHYLEKELIGVCYTPTICCPKNKNYKKFKIIKFIYHESENEDEYDD